MNEPTPGVAAEQTFGKPEGPSNGAPDDRTQLRTDFAGRQVRVWPPARPASVLRWAATPLLVLLGLVTAAGWLAFEDAHVLINPPGEAMAEQFAWFVVGLFALWPLVVAFKARSDAYKVLVLAVPSFLLWLYGLKQMTNDDIRTVLDDHSSASTWMTLWPLVAGAFLAVSLLRLRTEGAGRYTGSLPAKDILERQSWGRPGLGTAGVEVFGRSAEVGSTGERATATALANLLEHVPEARIFHGLRFPGSEVADIDHAVVLGDNLFLVDSKRWKHATYSWGQWGQVLRDGGEFDGGDVHMDAAVEKFDILLAGQRPPTSVFAFVLIVPDIQTGRTSTIEGNSWFGNVSLRSTPEDMVAAMLTMTDAGEVKRHWWTPKSERRIGGRFLNLRLVDEIHSGLIERT